jgi:hypothetical protein
MNLAAPSWNAFDSRTKERYKEKARRENEKAGKSPEDSIIWVLENEMKSKEEVKKKLEEDRKQQIQDLIARAVNTHCECFHFLT